MVAYVNAQNDLNLFLTNLTKSKITCLPVCNLFGKPPFIIQKIPFPLVCLKTLSNPESPGERVSKLISRDMALAAYRWHQSWQRNWHRAAGCRTGQEPVISVPSISTHFELILTCQPALPRLKGQLHWWRAVRRGFWLFWLIQSWIKSLLDEGFCRAEEEEHNQFLGERLQQGGGSLLLWSHPHFPSMQADAASSG